MRNTSAAPGVAPPPTIRGCGAGNQPPSPSPADIAKKLEPGLARSPVTPLQEQEPVSGRQAVCCARRAAARRSRPTQSLDPRREAARRRLPAHHQSGHVEQPPARHAGHAVRTRYFSHGSPFLCAPSRPLLVAGTFHPCSQKVHNCCNSFRSGNSRARRRAGAPLSHRLPIPPRVATCRTLAPALSLSLS